MYSSYNRYYPRLTYTTPSYGYTNRYRNRYSNLEYDPSPYWNNEYIYGPSRARPYSWERDYGRYRRSRRRARRLRRRTRRDNRERDDASDDSAASDREGKRRDNRERDDASDDSAASDREGKRRDNRGRDDASDDSAASDREDSPEPPKPPPKPEPPQEEIVKVLKVKSVDLHIKANTEKHKTDKYDCTESRTDDDGKTQPAELVLRRGDSFKMGVSFDRPYDKKDNDAIIVFSLGENATANKGSLIEMEVDETGKKTFGPEEWGASLHSKTGNDITVMVYVPANCIVGEWNLSVKSFSMGKDKDGKEATLIAKYKHDTDISILFNPWCKYDGVYMATENLLNEYILNENIGVYQGNSWTIGAKSWNLGQFEDGILDAAMYLMRAGFRLANSASMSDPIKVTRVIAKMVNQSDDNGVLVGNWSGKYEGGVSPSKWVGSVKILRQYMKKMEPVKYGQCWVFSCVTNTICRALGIPCRSITNFSSAHDTEESNTIDKYFDRVPGGRLEPNNGWDSDSIWNFHVWNEVWLARPDLEQTGFTGWQVIDATPQEASDGVYTCGPSPVAAIKRGLCRTQYDTAFVFSEVNADVVHWLITDTGVEFIKKLTRKVGQKISTKIPDGKPYKMAVPITERRSLAEIRRLDVTNEYKYPEGSTEERNAVLMAYRTAKRPHDGVYGSETDDTRFRLKLSHSNEVMIGSELPVQIRLLNEGNAECTVKTITLAVAAKTYIGETGKAFIKKDLGEAKIGAGKEATFTEVIKPADYLEHLVEQAGLYIMASAVFKGTRNRAKLTEHDFRFRRPDLDVKLVERASRGSTVRVDVSFTNPLNIPLTECDLSMESHGFKNMDDVKQKDVPANGVFKTSVDLVARKHGEHSVMFSFDCKELKDISGSGDIFIDRG